MTSKLQLFPVFICSLFLLSWDDQAGFSTTDELKDAFKTAYEGGDLEDLMDLVYWDNTPDEIKQSYKAFLSFGLGKHTVNQLEVVPLESLAPPENLSGRKIEAVITPTYWLAVAHSGNTGFKGSKATGSFQFAVGTVEGRYYIAGVRFVSDDAYWVGSTNPVDPAKPTIEEFFDDGKWTPPLGEGEQLLKVVSLAPNEILPIEGMIKSPGIYGIWVKKSWKINDREDDDGKDYWVYLRSPSSTPDRPNSLGTTYAVSNRFNPGDGVKYEVANETPIPVTVAIFKKEP